MEKICQHHVHRVFLVDKDGRPIKVLSLSDIIQAIVDDNDVLFFEPDK